MGVGGYILFWGITLLAAGLFLHRLYHLWRYLSLGQPSGKFFETGKRLIVTLVHVIGQWCQFKNLTRKDLAPIGHIFMAWGFLTFVLYYLIFIIIGTGFGLSGTLEHTNFFFYYSWVMNIPAPLIMIAALWGIIRRYVIKPPRLKGEQTIEAGVILGTVFIHPFTHLFKEATAIAAGHPPAGLGHEFLPPISNAISKLYEGASLSSIDAAHAAFFWAHWAIVLFVLVYIGYSRYLHMEI